MRKRRRRRGNGILVLLIVILINILFLYKGEDGVKSLFGQLYSPPEQLLEAPFEEPEDSAVVSETGTQELSGAVINPRSLPEYSGAPFVNVNNNVPFITDEELTTEPFETYSELDYLGRCGVAYCNACMVLRPESERESIGMVKPSGWNQNKYPEIIPEEPSFCYNRCHLIAFAIAAENDNEKNLITGTRYFNVTGMLPFEEQVLEYIDRNPENHVLYRVTPIYENLNLVASGVLMEARSVEDDGCVFCVYVYNVQPGIEINYLTGENHAAI